MAKTELTPEIQERLVTLLKTPIFRETAVAIAGVSSSAFHRWMRTGAAAADKLAAGESLTEREQRCYDLREAVTSAEFSSEHLIIAGIMNAGGCIGDDGQWVTRDVRVLQWLAERRWPQRWSIRVRQQVDEELSRMLKALEGRLSGDSFAEVVRALADAAAGAVSGEAGGGDGHDD